MCASRYSDANPVPPNPSAIKTGNNLCPVTMAIDLMAIKPSPPVDHPRTRHHNIDLIIKSPLDEIIPSQLRRSVVTRDDFVADLRTQSENLYQLLMKIKRISRKCGNLYRSDLTDHWDARSRKYYIVHLQHCRM